MAMVDDVGTFNAGGDSSEPVSSFEGCSDDSIRYAFTQVVTLRRALLAQELSLVAEVDRRNSWGADGATSLAAWVQAPTGMAARSAQATARLAVALERLPVLAAALATGAFDLDQALLVAKLVELAGEAGDDETTIVADAQGRSVAQLQAAVALARTVTATETNAAHGRRALAIRYDERAGVYKISGRLGTDGGATVQACLERIATAATKTTPETPYTERVPFPSAMADALVEVCSATIAADADADRATVVIHAPIEVLDAKGSALVVATDAAIGTETLRRILCDCRLELVADRSGADPYRLGRTTRTVPPAMSRQLRWRDRTCRFPGCERRRWVHAHHLRHWADDGPTDLDNLALLCNTHHQLVHEGGWQVTGDPDTVLEFTDPHDNIHSSRPANLRPHLRPPPPRMPSVTPPETEHGPLRT